MRNLIINTILIVTVSTLLANQADAQSGTRTGGFSSRGGGGASSGSRGSAGGIGGFSGRRLSQAERVEARRRRVAAQQQREQELRQQQAQQAMDRFQQTLVQLGNRPNSSANKRQNRLAFQEAKDNYRALRQRRVSPGNLGLLQQPFRLDDGIIDRSGRTANWPSTLLTPSYQTLVGEIDATIMNGGITDAETAQAFLANLNRLNQSLNAAAARGEVGSTEYARARRFISGLANEVKSSDLYM